MSNADGAAGTIVCSFAVFCHECPAHRNLPGLSLGDAAQAAREAGWGRRLVPAIAGSEWRRAVWVCPTCARVDDLIPGGDSEGSK